ncbi:MAG TPA: LysM peptidoglycan-binding domain-containing protein [Burkholderiales bacterium]|nr:LysM peptidoglycan-binding domain-containing protein [Burkholderiales bacterium]
MFKSSTALLLALALSAPLAYAQESKPVQLQTDAPDRHVVVKGDTLWGISGKFLKDPWRWPEVWGLNQEQVKNPHLIYPGDVIVLDRSAGQLRLERSDANAAAIAKAAAMGGKDKEPCVRVEGQSSQAAIEGNKLKPCIREEFLAGEAIPTIPAKVIEPFLSQPLVTDGSDFKIAPRITATQEGRFNLGPGNLAYASGITEEDPDTWNVYRNGQALIDPETHGMLGYEAIFLGTARVVKTGEPATLRIMSAKREISVGDRLLPATPPKVFNYAPHAPLVPVQGRVVSIYEGNTDARSEYYGSFRDPAVESLYGAYHETGPLSIVTINRGSKDGLEVGSVLALYRKMVLPNDRTSGDWYLGEKKKKDVVLPEERFGLVMVFRTFEYVSYALIVQAQRPVGANDVVVNP